MRSKLLTYLKERCRDRQVLLLGMGREGMSTYTLLREAIPDLLLYIGDKSIATAKEKLQGHNDMHLEYLDGTENTFDINRFDIIFKSPGIPASEFSLSRLQNSRALTSQTEVFLELFRDRVIGITGSKGKSTTTSLIYEMLREAGKKVKLAGNIGLPVFGAVSDEETDYFVCELSSHQLQHARVSPRYAVLLNLYEEHLDFYASYKEYQDAKLNIFRYQQEGDVAVSYLDNETLQSRLAGMDLKGKAYRYSLTAPEDSIRNGAVLKDGFIRFTENGKSAPVLDAKQVKYLAGRHNLQNMMAAAILGKVLQVPDASIASSVINFKGLPHRMQLIGEVRSILFYDDSISTIPEAAMYSAETLPNIGTLILGGMDRGVDYSELIAFLLKAGIDNLILIDAVGKKLYEALKEKKYNGHLLPVSTMEEAVELAFRHTSPGKSCVLSPAAASYGMFKNFEERGAAFQQLVLQHQAASGS